LILADWRFDRTAELAIEIIKTGVNALPLVADAAGAFAEILAVLTEAVLDVADIAVARTAGGATIAAIEEALALIAGRAILRALGIIVDALALVAGLAAVAAFIAVDAAALVADLAAFAVGVDIGANALAALVALTGTDRRVGIVNALALVADIAFEDAQVAVVDTEPIGADIAFAQAELVVVLALALVADIAFAATQPLVVDALALVADVAFALTEVVGIFALPRALIANIALAGAAGLRSTITAVEDTGAFFAGGADAWAFGVIVDAGAFITGLATVAAFVAVDAGALVADLAAFAVGVDIGADALAALVALTGAGGRIRIVDALTLVADIAFEDAQVAVVDTEPVRADIAFTQAQIIVIDTLALIAGGALPIAAGVALIALHARVGVRTLGWAGHTALVEVEWLTEAVPRHAALDIRIDAGLDQDALHLALAALEAGRAAGRTAALLGLRAADIVTADAADAAGRAVVVRGCLANLRSRRANTVEAVRGIVELVAILVVAALGGFVDTDRHAVAHTAIRGSALATERGLDAFADGTAGRAADSVGIEHLGGSDPALRIEAFTTGAADAVAASGAAGQLLGTADLFLDEWTFAEDPGQADGAVRTAFQVATLKELVTAVQSAGKAGGAAEVGVAASGAGAGLVGEGVGRGVVAGNLGWAADRAAGVFPGIAAEPGIGALVGAAARAAEGFAGPVAADIGRAGGVALAGGTAER
jgi:hypothetical protein